MMAIPAQTRSGSGDCLVEQLNVVFQTNSFGLGMGALSITSFTVPQNDDQTGE
jgi:hypothetical protein